MDAMTVICWIAFAIVAGCVTWALIELFSDDDEAGNAWADSYTDSTYC